MEQIRVSPIECGVLFILMGEGRPLKERAELGQVHGLTMKKAHRDRLKEHGLIRSSSAPFVHRLTKKGEDWVRGQFTASATISKTFKVPFGAVAAVLKRLSEEDTAPADDRKNGATELSRHIATAAWSEADEALGEALQAIPRVQRALEKLDSSGADHAGLTRQVQFTTDLVFQALRRAARNRELRLGSEPGAEAAFDPVRYYSDDHFSYGDQIRVVKPPVIRGQGAASVVVRIGEAVAFGK